MSLFCCRIGKYIPRSNIHRYGYVQENRAPVAKADLFVLIAYSKVDRLTFNPLVDLGVRALSMMW